MEDYINCEVLIDFECGQMDYSDVSGLMERKFLEEIEEKDRLNVRLPCGKGFVFDENELISKREKYTVKRCFRN